VDEMIRLRSFLFIIVIALTFGCGGGGGGGGGSAAGVGASTGARVLHASIDLSPIDIFTNPDEPAATARFGMPSPYVGLSSGPQGVLLKKANSSDVITNLSLNVEKGLRQSILVYGDYRVPALQIAVLQDIAPELDDTLSSIRVVNGLLSSGTSVSGAINATTAFAAPYGGATEYIQVPAGVANVVLDNGSSGSFTVEGGISYTILIAGQEGYFVKLVQLEN